MNKKSIIDCATLEINEQETKKNHKLINKNHYNFHGFDTFVFYLKKSTSREEWEGAEGGELLGEVEGKSA